MTDLYHLHECEIVGGCYRCPDCGRPLYPSHNGKALRCAGEECYTILVTNDRELWRKYRNEQADVKR